MANSKSTSHIETWRGAAVAVALAGLTLGGFLVIAYGRHWHVPAAAKSSPTPKKIQRPEESSPKVGKNDDDTQPPGAPGAFGLPSPHTLSGAGNPGQALREAIKGYKEDPNKTATVSITTSGQLRTDPAGKLTTLDGLSASAVKQGVMLTGSRAGEAPTQHP